MRIQRMLVLGLLLFIFSAGALAQGHEFAITAGGNFPRNNQYDPKNSFAVGVQYDGRIIHVPLAALYFDLPVVVAPRTSFNEPVACLAGTSCTFRDRYSAVFVTPGLKLKLAPEFPVSPYFVAGGGVAHYNLTRSSGSTLGDDSATKGVFEYGGGVDMKVAPFFSIRGDVRDFYSGSPSVGAIGDSDRQHNIITQLGLVFRF